MSEKKTSEAQLRANKKWAENNKLKRRIISLRGSARLFIRTYSTLEDLEELKRLVAEREKELREER